MGRFGFMSAPAVLPALTVLFAMQADRVVAGERQAAPPEATETASGIAPPVVQGAEPETFLSPVAPDSAQWLTIGAGMSLIGFAVRGRRRRTEPEQKGPKTIRHGTPDPAA